MKNEGIRYRTMDITPSGDMIRMRLLNEPYGAFGKYRGDFAEAALCPLESGKLRAVAAL